MKANKLRKFILTLIVPIIGALAHTSWVPWSLRINRTDSLPYTLFVSRKINRPLQVGDYISFSRNGSSAPLVKQIRGLPGDLIEKRSSPSGVRILVGGKDCGIAYSYGPKTGKKLEPIEAYVIPEGKVYVYSTHLDSYDSRYETFGLIQAHQIKEIVWPIF